MAYDKNQSDFPMPTGDDNNRSSSNFLPKYFRTDTNNKFLQSTIDQFISEGVVEKLNGFVGRRYAKANLNLDAYVSEISSDRENYQFEPSIVYKDEIGNVEFYANYNDYIGQIGNFFKDSVSNHSLLNRQKSYSWNPHIDWDKFANFREYYWLPMGPPPVSVFGQTKDILSTYTVETVNDDNNVAYLISPDGLTRNPSIKLYRGQTYRFEINAPGHGIAVTQTRDFDDNNPLLGIDQENNSILYLDGITKYEFNAAGDLVVSTSDYIENGVIEFTPTDNSPDTLYYVSQRDINTSGFFSLYFIEENSEIDVDAEIIGKKEYTTSTGIKLSNGMKVYFQGDATPATYNNGYYYVEGVGTAIVLVNEIDLEVPSVFTSVKPIPFDTNGFDKFPFEDAASYPANKDYITINRTSPDSNAWSRYNRWFHQDVINQSYIAAGLDIELDQSARAKRPIIEFEAGIKLFNHGVLSKDNVTLIDTTTKDVFSTIEGKGGYLIDGVEVTEDMRILFTADTDSRVAGKIYQAKFINFGTGIEKTRQITLVETTDTTPLEGETVLVTNGNSNIGKMFHYENSKWIKSQEKTKVNQTPLFDMFDETDVSLTDTVYYPSSSFKGNSIFSYAIGKGTIDTELGFALTYQNIANIGDIVFNFNYTQNSFKYQSSSVDFTKRTDTCLLRQYDKFGNYKIVNAWKESYQETNQAVIRLYTGFGKNYAVDVFDNSLTLADLNVSVSVNGVKKVQGVDYTLVNGPTYKEVQFVSDLTSADDIVLKCYSTANKTAQGFYEIPLNFESNPLNQDVTTFTLGAVSQHVDSITENLKTFTGRFPGTSNLRDLGNTTSYGTKFVQHAGPLNLAMYHIVNKNANVIKSLEFAQQEYTKFKRQFLTEAGRLGFDGTPKKHVDLILKKINNDKTSSFPFFSSDMVAFHATTETLHTVEYNGESYFALKNVFDLVNLTNKSVLVYVNDVQLTHNIDYVFEDQFVKVTKTLIENDEVTVVEYENTNGCYVAPTPAKLGLLPSYIPEIYIDDTYIGQSYTMIRGHDGSIVKAFGDYRDALILELELRIYNNIKNLYDPEKLDIWDITPGFSRNTELLNLNTQNLLLQDFSKWLDRAGNPDYSTHTFWNSQDPFTYNYSNMVDKLGNKLTGFWRDIFFKYYDTDRPHTNPWEMLGFSFKPTWWETQYGPAPYTSDNTILWQDLRDGLIKEPGKAPVQDKKFIRSSLMSIIPVDDSGNLRDPLSAGIATNFVLTDTNQSFKFGDRAPVETAWRRTSEYQFSLLKYYLLIQPAKVMGFGFDISRIKKDLAGNFVYAETNKRIALADIVFPNVSEDETTTILTSGLVNYISNYVKFNLNSKYVEYKQQLAGLDNQLSFRVAGFADKSKLKLVLDSRSPLNKTSVFVPDENYEIILNKSAVQDTPSLSGLIIEKVGSVETGTAGYLIKGYDKESPYFSIYKAVPKNKDTAITVGGISENYIDWAERKTYAIGSIVFYNGEYYRSTLTHESTTEFDTSKFSKLAELPITGGVTALVRTGFKENVTSIPYGTKFSTIQEVVDFMIGYEHWLTQQGFIFENLNQTTGQIEDMKIVAQEFMFWVTQNWKEGTVLAISPIANLCTFSRPYYSVDNIYDPFYGYTILAGTGQALEPNFTNIYRNNDIDFAISSNGKDGIYLIKLPLVQTEHVVLIDNKTVFNDIIYDTVSGVRQDRIKVVGYRTDGWTGNLNIPGFIYDNAKVKQWTPWTDYTISDLIKYKEFYYSAFNMHTSKETFNDTNWRKLNEKPVSQIYPNWDYKANQFADFYDLDTDNFDTEQQRLAQHLIGYQPRQYLANIITDSISQYKFYQGFIQEKGTKNALTKLFDPLSAANKDSVEFYEEWALRLGQYGAIDNILETEFNLNEAKYKLEPQIVELNSTINPTRTDLVYEITPSQVYKKPTNYNHTIVPQNNTTGTYTKDSGYVKNEQVSYILNSWEFITDIPVNKLSVNENIWITNDENNWNTYKLTNTDYNILDVNEITYSNIDAIEIITEQQITDLAVDDYIAIRSKYAQLNAFVQVLDVAVDKIIVVGTNRILLNKEANEDSTVSASISKFVKRRFTDVDSLNSTIEAIDRDTVDTIWLDNDGTGNWNVYENKPIFGLQKEIANKTATIGFASAFDLNKSNSSLVFGNSKTETVLLQNRISDQFDFKIPGTEFKPSNVAHDIQSEYGHSVSISPDGQTIAVGAPLASNALTRFVGNLEPGVSYAAGDIVSDRGTFWKAKVNIAVWENALGDSSTIDINAQDWERAYIITAGEGSSDSSHANQGVVYVYEKNKETQAFSLSFILTSPEPIANQQFGLQVKLVNTAYSSTKLFVSAPGTGTGKVYFFEKIDQWKWSRNENYKGLYEDYAIYNEGDIVYYAGELKIALTTHNPTDPNPTDTDKWTTITTDIEHTGFVPNLDRELDGEVVDTQQTNFGIKFAVNLAGDKLAVVSYVNNSRVVKVFNQIDNRWNYIQTISDNETNSEFGYNIAINEDGDKIVVSSPWSDLNGTDSGAVYMYQQGSDTTYSLAQTIQSPYKEQNEVFGFNISLSGNKLAILGKNSDTIQYTTFDLKDENDVTLFDNGTTEFSLTDTDSGRIFLYQEINDKFVFGEDVDYRRKTYGHSLENFKLNGNHIYISIPTMVPSADTLPSEADNTKYATSVNKGIFVDMYAVRNTDTWLSLENQNSKPDINKIEKVFVYNIDTQDIVQQLDWIDPRQGKIASVAEAEIAYKTPYDPAVYSSSNGFDDVVVDSSSNWTDKQVGQIWWNTGIASWYNPYQGDSNYRTSKFNSVIPGYQIQVCEWVSSKVLPTQWNTLSGTTEGYAKGISGTTLYDDNVYSVKRVYDTVKQAFSNHYYFWVRNADIIPNFANRQLSTQSIANLIADPAGQGYRFVALLGVDKFALYNCKSLIEGTNSVLHFRTKIDEDLTTNVHTEYQLLSQGLDLSQPNADIETKWIDSLVGYDLANKQVPDPSLPVTQKYGILNLPRQSMFVNRIEAVKQFVDRVNWVFSQNQIVDNYELTNLLKVENAPNILARKYDAVADTDNDLQYVGVAKTQTASIGITVEYGKITQVQILNSGRGYKYAPEIEIEDGFGTGAILNSTINNLGQIINVDIRSPGSNYSSNTIVKVRNFSALVLADSTIGNIWAIYSWNKTTNAWERVSNQSYDTTKYWNYTDWYKTNYTPNTVVNYVIDQSYELFGINDKIGDVVKINTIGTGGWLLLKKIADVDTEDYTVNYETIARQNGTIELSSMLYRYSTETSGYDTSVYDLSFYDKEPVQELRNILAALKTNIFIGDLLVEYNELFFAGVRYAFNEQNNVDWAFKTSFARAKHNVGDLIQKVSFQNDNLESYQDYINEVKPYKTKIREYISTYTHLEPTGSLVTDFDLPPSYINGVITPSVAIYKNQTISNIFAKYNTYPFKSWVDNNGYDVTSIEVADGGTEYLTTPTVTVSGDNNTTATAYLARGSVKSIEIVNKGGKYYKAPTVTITGTSTTPARAVAILGNSNARSVHMIVKFDRVSGKSYIESINATETFTGTGSKEQFFLKWPMNIKTDSFVVSVNGRALLSNKFTIGNKLDTTATYEKHIGYVKFINAPAVDAVISITYKKSINMLKASDRIFEEYSPTSGMPGINDNNSLSALMKGVEYEGAIYNSIDFGNEQGFGVGGFGSIPWDTFTNTYEDEIIVLDGSSVSVTLSQPLEDGVEYNIYYNDVRLDNSDSSISSIIGDGVTDEVIINDILEVYGRNLIIAQNANDLSFDPNTITIEDINTLVNNDGDVIVIRKTTSDGSFTPTAASYDTSLVGGSLDYTTATGLPSGEIIVDGDGFRTQANSSGPEELVPGTITDALDMTVYHRTTDGVGYIGVVNYWTDGETFEYALPAQPATADSLIVILNGDILDSTLYTVNYEQNILHFDDSTSSVDSNLCIITVGVNGADLIDQNVVVYEEGVDTIMTLANFADAKSALVVENGVLLQNEIDYVIENSGNGDDSVAPERYNKAVLRLLKGENNKIATGTKIQYAIYNNTVKSFSQIIIDKTFNADSTVNNYHKFTGNIPVPFGDLPLSHKIIVKSGDRVLSPGYSVHYTTTSSRIYNIDSWQFEDPTNIPDIDILVFVDGQQLEKKYWNWNPVSSEIRLLRNDIAPANSSLDIYFLTNAEYYFVDTKITIGLTESSPVLTDIISAGETVRFTSNTTSTSYEFIAEEVTASTVTVRSINKEIRNEYISSDEFVISVNDQDSTYLTVVNVEYVLSDNITINKEQILDIEIIQFSNHDINNFKRYTLDVVTTTSVDENSDEYTKRALLSSGIIKLTGEVPGTKYVWVFKNGTMLSPFVDYIVGKNLKAVELTVKPNETDTIDVLQFSNNVTTPQIGYRIFKDMVGRTHYKRINDGNSYELANELNYYDARIVLTDATGIQQPNPARNAPGIIWIDGERIEYFKITGNNLLQLRRGTLGTGVPEVHTVGSYVLGQGINESINYNDTFDVHTTKADGSTRVVDMAFSVLNVNEVEVFVGGRRLRKNAISIYNPALDQDSPAGDETSVAEYSVAAGIITLATLPADGTLIKVVKKTGKIWTETGVSLAESQKPIGKFLRGATIRLPR